VTASFYEVTKLLIRKMLIIFTEGDPLEGNCDGDRSVLLHDEKPDITDVRRNIKLRHFFTPVLLQIEMYLET